MAFKFYFVDGLLFSFQGMLKPTLDEIFRHWLLLVLEGEHCKIQNVRRGWGSNPLPIIRLWDMDALSDCRNPGQGFEWSREVA